MGKTLFFTEFWCMRNWASKFVDTESMGILHTKGSRKGCRFVPVYGRVPMERQVRSQPNRLKHGENDGDEWRNCVEADQKHTNMMQAVLSMVLYFQT